MTQEKLAKLIFTSRATIVKWENGDVLPSANHLMNLCTIFDCEMNYLLCQQDFKHSSEVIFSPLYGLTEKTLEILKKKFSNIVNSELDEYDIPECFFDSFDMIHYFNLLNHFINEFFFCEIEVYLQLEELNILLQQDPYREIILEVFSQHKVLLSSLISPLFVDKDTSVSIQNHLIDKLIECGIHKKMSNEEFNALVTKSSKYIPLLCTDKYAIEQNRFNTFIKNTISTFIKKEFRNSNFDNFIRKCISQNKKNKANS